MDEMTYTLQELAELSGIEARTIRSYIERDLLPGPYGLGPKAAYGQEHVDRLKVLGLLRNAHRAITLDQIRTLLGQLTPEQIAAIADGRQKVSTAFGGGLPVSSALTYLKSITVRGDRRDRSERGPSGYRSEPSEPAASAASAEPAEPASPSPLPGPSAPNLRTSPRPPASPRAASARMAPVSGPPDFVSAPLDAGRSSGRPELRRSAELGRTPFEQLLEALDGVLASENVSRSVRSETWHRIPITPDIELSVRGELDADQLAVLQRIGDHLRHLLMKGNRK